MNIFKSIMTGLSLFVLALLVAQPVVAETLLKPHVLASKQAGQYKDVINKTRQSLKGAGFTIAGEYSPYKDTTILAVTNAEMQKVAAQSEHGGYGAVQRVAVSKVSNEIQVVFSNPVYYANVYRMKSDLAAVGKQLEKALGKVKDFGAEGLSANDLRDYHYKVFMPYFDDPYEIASFPSHVEAVKAVESGLKAGNGGVSKVYRIDIPGKEEVVFGVGMTRDCSGDEFIMGKIDFGKIKSTSHLPYEMMVSGKNVVALHAKFRIAISFPDLSMVGNNSFFSIMCAPGEIEDALTRAVKGDKAVNDAADW